MQVQPLKLKQTKMNKKKFASKMYANQKWIDDERERERLICSVVVGSGATTLWRLRQAAEDGREWS